ARYRLLTPISLPLFALCYAALRDLHSFPTRRSSDLVSIGCSTTSRPHRMKRWRSMCSPVRTARCPPSKNWQIRPASACRAAAMRSEEHTSELQSRFDLVCRLLLEKKKHTRESDRRPS